MRVFISIVIICACYFHGGGSWIWAGEPREWIAAGGAFSLRANLVSADRGLARLRATNGQLFEIAIRDLRNEDQVRIRQIQAAHSPAQMAALKRVSAEVKRALADRDLPRAKDLAAQFQELAASTDSSQPASVISRSISDIEEFWRAYRRGAQGLQTGDRLTLGHGVCRIASTLENRVAIALDGMSYDFDITRLPEIPHELAIAIARRASADTTATRRSLLSFRSVDDATRDRALWQAARRTD